MDAVIDFMRDIFALGALIPLSAVITPWGPFKRRWIGLVASLPLILIFNFFHELPPSRPSNVPQAEWDRRIALCHTQASGGFKDCVRDPVELKKAEQNAAQAKKEEDDAKRAEAASDNANKPLPPDQKDKRLADNSKVYAPALSPYTQKDDPDLYAQWGARGIQRINALRKAAAYAVSKKENCDVVDLADIADQRSKPPSNVVIYVQCRNQQQYYISQSDLDHDAVVSEDEWVVAVKSLTFRTTCSEGAQSMLTYPSSYDQHIFGGGPFKDDAGNHGLAIDFDAKNSLGNAIPQVALCTIMPSGKVKIQIRNR